VPAVSLATLLPNLPLCPVLSPSSPQCLAPPAPLTSLLTLTHSPATSSSSVMSSSSPPPSAFQPLDLLSRFLVYPSSKRLKAADALLHPWFVSGLDEVGLVLPVEYRQSQPKVDCSQDVSADVGNSPPLPQVKFSYEWGGKSLGECLSEVLISIPGSS
jgi:hypothetical protein